VVIANQEFIIKLGKPIKNMRHLEAKPCRVHCCNRKDYRARTQGESTMGATGAGFNK
jgi:hypothetical protein